jgi:hypothetical protein
MDMEWQDISTAPKDGIYILAARYDGFVKVVKFCPHHNLWRQENGNYWGTNAPTHWMPLPPPPKA